MTALDRAARLAWVTWAPYYAQWTICFSCNESRYCRAKQKHSHWLCLDCWDQGAR